LKENLHYTLEMAPIITPVSAILAGKVHIRLRVRVIHMWTVPDYNNPQEDGVLHMLLMDEKVFLFRVFVSVLVLF